MTKLYKSLKIFIYKSHITSVQVCDQFKIVTVTCNTTRHECGSQIQVFCTSPLISHCKQSKQAWVLVWNQSLFKISRMNDSPQINHKKIHDAVLGEAIQGKARQGHACDFSAGFNAKL